MRVVSYFDNKRAERARLARGDFPDPAEDELRTFDQPARRAPSWLALKDAVDDELGALVSLDQLRSLSLADSRVSDAGLKHLAPLKRLKHLDLSRTRVVGPGLADLAALRDLKILDLSGTRVDDGLKHLAGCNHLTTLRLGSAEEEEEQATPDVDRPVLISNSMFRWVSPRVKRDNRSAVTDAGLAHLASLARLESLCLCGCNIRGPGLAHLTKLGRLARVDLSASDVGDAGMTFLAAIPELEVLDLSNTAVTDAGLAALAPSPHLEVLKVSGASVTDEGVEAFRKAQPTCRVFGRGR